MQRLDESFSWRALRKNLTGKTSVRPAIDKLTIDANGQIILKESEMMTDALRIATPKQIVERALDDWTYKSFCKRASVKYGGDGLKPVAWCAVGRIFKAKEELYNEGYIIPGNICIVNDFVDKYLKRISAVNDGLLGYWRVKRMLRKLYA